MNVLTMGFLYDGLYSLSWKRMTGHYIMFDAAARYVEPCKGWITSSTPLCTVYPSIAESEGVNRVISIRTADVVLTWNQSLCLISKNNCERAFSEVFASDFFFIVESDLAGVFLKWISTEGFFIRWEAAFTFRVFFWLWSYVFGAE